MQKQFKVLWNCFSRRVQVNKVHCKITSVILCFNNMNLKIFRWCAIPQYTNASMKTYKLSMFFLYKKATQYDWFKRRRVI